MRYSTCRQRGFVYVGREIKGEEILDKLQMEGHGWFRKTLFQATKHLVVICEDADHLANVEGIFVKMSSREELLDYFLSHL